MEVRVERLTERLNLANTLLLQNSLELAIDESDAIKPTILGKAVRNAVESPLQVIEHRKQAQNERGVAKADRLAPLLLSPPLVVYEIRLRPLPVGKIALSPCPLLIKRLLQGFNVLPHWFLSPWHFRKLSFRWMLTFKGGVLTVQCINPLQPLTHGRNSVGRRPAYCPPYN